MKSNSRKPTRTARCAATSESLERLKERFVHRMQVRNLSSATIRLRRAYLERFLTWCDQRGIVGLEEITRDVVLGYQRYLYHYRSEKTGEPLKFSTQVSLLGPIRAWFCFLVREKMMDHNPAGNLDLPKPSHRLPSGILTADEVERILNVPDVTRALGLRDRAMLETLYSTAMRRSELIGLEVYDLDHERGLVTIRHGKGQKDRNVPIGERALGWVANYVETARPRLIEGTSTTRLFVSITGHPFGAANLSNLVAGYIRQSGVRSSGSCHMFRHAAATLMMERGADLRSLQALLGHAQLTTTQIYTHVSISHLKEVHRRTHPTSTSSLGAELPDADASSHEAVSSPHDDRPEFSD